MSPQMYGVARYRAFVDAQDCRAVCLVIGSGLRPVESDFYQPCAAQEFINQFFWKTGWCAPLMHDALTRDQADYVLSSISGSMEGAVLDYITVSDLSHHRVQGEFFSIAGSDDASNTGGVLVSNFDSSFVGSDALGIYRCYGEEAVSAHDLLSPLTTAIDEYPSLDALSWNSIFNGTNPRIAVMQSSSQVTVRDEHSRVLKPVSVVDYPHDHDVWELGTQRFGEDIHFDIAAANIQATSMMVTLADK